jgi:tetratricopeptide (TPR) repeat protein
MPAGNLFCRTVRLADKDARRRLPRARRALLWCGTAVLAMAPAAFAERPSVRETKTVEWRGQTAVRQAPPGPSPAEPGTVEIAERVNRVRADLLSGTAHFADDIQQLKGILAIAPRSAEAHLLLGIAYRGQGSPDLVGETIAEFRQALEVNPAFIPPRFYLAQMYLDLGRAERAREELEAGLVQVPRNPQFLALLGESERQLKNPARAVDLTRQAVEADAAFAQARYYLGLALFDVGRRADAIRELEQVVQSGPNVSDPYRNLGAIYLDAGRVDDAIEVLSRGARVDGTKSDLRVQLARAYRLKGLLVKADEQLTLAGSAAAAAQGSPFAQEQHLDFDLYLEQGLLRLQQGRLDAAANALQRALGLDPNHGPATRSLAEVYLRQGQYPRALEYATRAEKLGFPLPDGSRTLLQQKLRGAKTGARE